MRVFRLGLSLVVAACALALAPVTLAQKTEQQIMDELKGIVPIGLRSIPSESMLPNLLVGDRVAIVAIDRELRRGDVVIFQHPNSDRVMIDRIIGLPGDTVQMKRGQLWLNGEMVERTLVRDVRYWSEESGRSFPVREYSEQLPGADKPYLIHEFSDADGLDETPEFRVPAGHLFLMGDNRDNSEDSRAPSGQRAMARAQPEGWLNLSVRLPADMRDDAIGFVPTRNLMGRAASVVYTLNVCAMRAEDRAAGAECLRSRLWQGL